MTREAPLCRTRLTIVLLLCIVAPIPTEASASEAATEDASDPIVALIAAAEADPDAHLGALLAYLAASGAVDPDGFYILEGDLRMSREQVGEYFRTPPSTARPERETSANELMVNVLPDGSLDHWSAVEDRHLTYAVRHDGFSRDEHLFVVRVLGQAARDWESVCNCGVRFEHLTEHDSQPSHDRVDFIVRRVKHGKFIAAAFFPSYPQTRRFLDIDDTFFDAVLGYDPTGVLRHELGHVLGYRHEHITGIRGCRREGGQWHAITTYDPTSVMHYPCGGQGSRTFDLSEKDREGHRALYGEVETGTASFSSPSSDGTAAFYFVHSDSSNAMAEAVAAEDPNSELPAPADSAGKRTLRIELEAADYAAGAARILRILHGMELLQQLDMIESHELGKDGTVCKAYGSLPGRCTSELVQLAAEINGRDLAGAILQPDDEIKRPTVVFEPYEYSRVLYDDDPEDQVLFENLKARQASNIVGTEKLEGATRVDLRGFQLVLENVDEKLVPMAVDALDKAGLDGVTVWAPEALAAEAPRLHSVVDPGELLANCEDSTYLTTNEGYYGRLLGSGRFSERYAATRCFKGGAPEKRPQVLLVDSEVGSHPDLVGALEGWQGTPPAWTFEEPPVPAPGETVHELCNEVAASRALHGTHQACIVACQRNGVGYAGVCPAAEIHPHRWSSSVAGDLALREVINHRYPARNDIRPTVVLFASEIPYEPKFVEPVPIGWEHDVAPRARRLRKREHRTNTGTFRALNFHDRLLVAAVGQPLLPEEEPVELDTSSTLHPMNVGDQRNVVIVTACELCDSGPRAVRLWSRANYAPDPKLVHLAAPGIDIAGVLTGSEVGRRTGTSPSAAFVAGVAAAMLAEYPDQYQRAETVKVQLQVTSTPILQVLERRRSALLGLESAGESNPEISGGVVDLERALLDPRTAWFQAWGTADMSQHDDVAWCAEALHLAARANVPDLPARWNTRTSTIRRIMSVGKDAAGEEQWVVFRTTDLPGEVEIVGPGTLPLEWARKMPLVRLESGGQAGELLQLFRIRDLILPTGTRLVPKDGNGKRCGWG